MSLQLSKTSITSVYGTLSGFARPITENSNLMRQFEKSVVLEMMTNGSVFVDRNFSNARIFRVISQIIVPKVVSKAYPLIPTGVIALKEPLFFLILPSILSSIKCKVTYKVNILIREFFQKQVNFILLTQTEVTTYIHELLCFFPSKIGFKEVMINEDLSEEDLKTLALDKRTQQILQRSKSTIGPRGFTCHAFALLKSKEKRIAEYLFDPNPNKDLRTFLKKWGYQVVDDLQPNDLVLYLDKGILMHTARYLQNGIVESKMGNKTIVCTQHPLADVWSLYGNQMLFFRKV